jgi:hypothetical protein
VLTAAPWAHPASAFAGPIVHFIFGCVTAAGIRAALVAPALNEKKKN